MTYASFEIPNPSMLYIVTYFSSSSTITDGLFDVSHALFNLQIVKHYSRYYNFIFRLFSQELVTAITWAHNDQKFFVATKNILHSINIHRGIPSLQSLCQASIANSLLNKEDSFDLVLPTKLKVAVAETFDPIIQVCMCVYMCFSV